MKPIAVVLSVAAALLSFAAPAAAQGVYGALAISPSTGAYGFGYNYDTAAAARDRAMTECRKHAQDCQVYAQFQRQCIAVARAKGQPPLAFPWWNEKQQRFALDSTKALREIVALWRLPHQTFGPADKDDPGPPEPTPEMRIVPRV
jgi:serine/threonine-protein kinase